MDKLIIKLTSNIGAKLKLFFLYAYVIECMAGLAAAFICFIWQLSEGDLVVGAFILLGGFAVPFVLYPVFMMFYGYAIMVHKMEYDSEAASMDDGADEPETKAPAAKETAKKDIAEKVEPIEDNSADKAVSIDYKVAWYLKTHWLELILLSVSILVIIGVLGLLFKTFK